MEFVVALSAIAGLPLIARMPEWLLGAIQGGMAENFILLHGYLIALGFILMFLPTLLLGALFPLITALWTRDAGAVGRGVGTAYAANTVGTILGSLLGGLVLLPALGVQSSILVASFLHAAVACAFWWMRAPRGRFIPRLVTAAAALGTVAVAAWAVPAWDRAMMTAGVFTNHRHYGNQDGDLPLDQLVHKYPILYYAEGIDGTVSVVQESDQRVLYINGKADASSKSDLRTQVLLGQIPVLLHPDPRNVLVVGLGSGITSGAAATHSSIERLDVLEISREVTEASALFSTENQNVLADPRVNLVVADARNYLLAPPRQYDLIISQPSNPWISGISNLFTRDFFAQARNALAADGIMAQWFHTYSMAIDDVRTLLETYQSVFSHVTVWMTQGSDLVLVGSNAPHGLDFGRVQRALAEPAIHESLTRARGQSMFRLVNTYLIGGDELASYSAGAPLNTDDRPRIEFNAPRSLYRETSLENLFNVLEHLLNAEQRAPVQAVSDKDASPLRAMGLRYSGSDKTSWLRPDNSNSEFGWMLTRKVTHGEELPNGFRLTLASRRLLEWGDADRKASLSARAMPLEPDPGEVSKHIDSFP
jgi:spermidine synthase